VVTGDDRQYPFFEPDEYTAINDLYFAEMNRVGSVEIDPSGWVETLSDAANMVLPAVRKLPLGRYYMDEGSTLGEVRSSLHDHLCAWEGVVFDPMRFTACPSVGVASLLAMAVLRRKGVKRVVFETPCYFAAILQAEWLGLDVVLMPTYRRDGYRRPTDFEVPITESPCAWWLTHPRVTLGFNQDGESLLALLGGLRGRDYVIIDEALDQSFPSAFGGLHLSDSGRRLIRFKAFGKPLGLNGYRLAFVLHAPELRADMVDCLETFAGAIDVHSLEAACAVAAEPEHFSRMMSVAKGQVVALRVAAEKIAAGSAVVVNPLTNGYLGSAIVDLDSLGPDQNCRRHRFLLGCQKRGMPVIIGPSMHFASDPPSEAVRLNFFSAREHLLRGVAALSEIAAGIT
jgi:histidinol-phosphate/aromatic aminotransferase/cobyric acid decarboxylase-like protein